MGVTIIKWNIGLAPPPPGSAVGAIFQDDPLFFQFIPDAVGLGEILGRAGDRTFFYQRINFHIGYFASNGHADRDGYACLPPNMKIGSSLKPLFWIMLE